LDASFLAVTHMKTEATCGLLGAVLKWMVRQLMVQNNNTLTEDRMGAIS
jgi:hypothetical protein